MAIQRFGTWTMENDDNYRYFLHCRNELVPQVVPGYRILWSVSRSLDIDGVYRGAANVRGYYVRHERPAFGARPEVPPHTA